MKLYSAAGTCSLASKIVLNEAGCKYEIEKVDIRAKQYSGGDFRLKAAGKEAIAVKLGFVSDKLKGGKFLMGDRMTAPDAYLYTCLRWSPYFGIDLSKWPEIEKFMGEMSVRASVKEALASDEIKS